MCVFMEMSFHRAEEVGCHIVMEEQEDENSKPLCRAYEGRVTGSPQQEEGAASAKWKVLWKVGFVSSENNKSFLKEDSSWKWAAVSAGSSRHWDTAELKVKLQTSQQKGQDT